MQEKSYKTTTDLLTRAKEAIDIPFGSIDSTGRLEIGKNYYRGKYNN